MGILFFLVCIGSYSLGLGAVLFNGRQRLANTLANGCALAGGIAGVAAAVRVLLYNDTFIVPAWKIVHGITITFALDRLSAFFLLVISLVTVAVSVYAVGYVTERFERKDAGVLGALLNAFVLSMVMVVTANNALVFLLAWEMMALFSFFLVMADKEKSEVRSAGYVYLIMTHFGTVCITVMYLVLFLYSGSLEFAAFREHADTIPAVLKNVVFTLCLIGFGTKAGIIPLHVWLPRAHPVAPSHVSALMSAVMLKTAAYALIRVLFEFVGGGPVWWGLVLMAAGAFSAVIGIIFAVAENDMKRFLAYSSAENMGIVFTGTGAALVFFSVHYPLLGALALTAALYHVFNHAMFKGLLFMGAGSVLFAARTKDVNRLGGLIHTMPWTAAFFLVGGASLAALPPLGGFISEWATLESLLHMSFTAGAAPVRLAGCIAAASLAFAGACAAGGVIKHFGTAFLAMPRSAAAREAREVGIWMKAGMGILAAICGVCGLWPGFLLQLVSGITAGYFGEYIAGSYWLYVPFSGAAESVSPGAAAVLFLSVAAVGIIMLRGVYGKSRYRLEETWNCGTELTSEMAYTGTSYSQPILVIFRKAMSVLRTVKVDQQYDYYPKRIHYSSEIRSRFEQVFYKPVVRMTIAIARRIRTIQNGNLQSYLAYMVAALILTLFLGR